MAIVTLGELLDRGRELEIRLETYYAEIRDQATDNGVRLLTYYLVRHRRHQEQTLSGLNAETLRHMRSVELKFDAAPDHATQCPAAGDTTETVRGDAMIETAIRHDETLVALYRSVLAQPLNDEVRGVVESLIRVEERDIVMLKKMLAMHYF